MDELEIVLMMYLRSDYAPSLEKTGASKATVDLLVRQKFDAWLPILRVHRQSSGKTGSLTEDEIVSASLEATGRGIDRTISHIEKTLGGDIDDERRQLLEVMLAGAKARSAEAHGLATDPSQITDEGNWKTVEEVTLNLRKMVSVTEQSTLTRLADLRRRGHASEGDDLHLKFADLRKETDLAYSADRDLDVSKDRFLSLRQLQADFYGMLKRREREANNGS